MQEAQERKIGYLSQEDPLEEKMAICSSILAWKIQWTGEPCGLLSMGSQRDPFPVPEPYPGLIFLFFSFKFIIIIISFTVCLVRF